tara:strand:- start:288 stop:500 length:213 start_codon:yes stop_codon:yes gene_type:complete
MIYIKYIQTYTEDSRLGFKGEKTKCVGEFEDQKSWLIWLDAINGNGDIDFDLPYVVSNFEHVKNLEGDAL